MSDLMTFPDTWEEFEQEYGFTDREQIYTNGSRLIQSFRVKQWLEHISADMQKEPDEPILPYDSMREYQFEQAVDELSREV